MLIGIISDTHGLLRPEAISALHGVDLIIHAGDMGKPNVVQGWVRWRLSTLRKTWQVSDAFTCFSYARAGR